MIYLLPCTTNIAVSIENQLKAFETAFYEHVLPHAHCVLLIFKRRRKIEEEEEEEREKKKKKKKKEE